MNLTDLAEHGNLPDALIRHGIRRLCRQRLLDEGERDCEAADSRFRALVESLKLSPVAIETKAANEQHYELPTEFFKLCLGGRLKYSSAFYPTGDETLDEAEEIMLGMYGERAELKDGQRILELGCGWGSLTLWMAEYFPASRITAVSNSNSQREYIQQQAKQRGLGNIDMITCDVNQLNLDKQFDRVVSVEMFEHMRNYELLMEKIAGMLTAEGKLFVHIFTHQSFTYYFDVIDESDWMSKYFFTGGIMPSDDLLLYFNKDLKIQQHFHWDGTHYEKTANCWLENMDKNRQTIMPILSDTYGAQQATKWWVYWRIFFMACAELWGYNKGREWFVSHYLFVKA